MHWSTRVASRLLSCGAVLALSVAANPAAHAQGSVAIPDIAGQVMTVTGPMDPDELGDTLMHEHIFIDRSLPWNALKRWKMASRTRPKRATAVALYHSPVKITNLGAVTMGAPNRDNELLQNEATAVSEVAYFKAAGGGTIVDVTSEGIGRQPVRLRRVSVATGVPVIMGSSWYTRAWYPDDLAQRSVASLAREIVHDVTVGVGDAGIRSGIIGEVGVSMDPTLPTESRIIRASGRASRLTGAALTLHIPQHFADFDALFDMLEDEGVDLSRVIVGHVAYLINRPDVLNDLLQRGVTIEFDCLGRPQILTRHRPLDPEIARAIVKLVDAGHIRQITLSQNVHAKINLRAYGGTGYTYLELMFLPYLERLGLTDEQVHTITVENPRRLLTFVAPKPALTND